MENGKGMEKWEDKRDFNFSNLCLVGWKHRKMRKMSLYKFTYKPLIIIIII